MSSRGMADQVYRSIAAEGKRIPTWDVESILTRAVYRALSSNGQLSQALDHPPVNVDKYPVSTDAHVQLKLVAEKLCKRVERRYEKKLMQQRERDRTEIAHKLSEIRSEYSEQVEAKRRDLERERVRLEEDFAEKERTLRHKLEMQLAEKENALEITRKSLENRLAEISMNKEHLDRIKAEFHIKFASDVEKLNEEWERLSAKREELRALFQGEFEEEQQQLKEKLVELENENGVLRKKLSENGIELFEMRSKLSKVATLEGDLYHANERLRKELEENHRLSRSRYEAEHFREENTYLKEEIERLRTATRQQNAPMTIQSSSKSSEDIHQMKIRELKTIIRMMNDKIMSLSSERDYLREMLRDAKRYVFRETAGRKQPGLDRVAGSLRSQRLLCDTDSSEDTSISSSALSECALDLRNIKERFATLETMAKTLDTTIDCVAAARSLTHDPLATSPELSVSENYDDFCRAVKKNDLHSSPAKHIIREVPKRLDYDTLSISAHEVPRSDEQRIPDESTPRAAVLSSTDPRKSETKQQPYTVGGFSEVTPETPKASTEPPGQAVSFAERLRARTESSRKLNFSQASQETAKIEPDVHKNTGSDQNATALDSYMALFEVNPATVGREAGSGPKATQASAGNDVPFEVEDVQVDKPGGSDDEIEW